MKEKARERAKVVLAVLLSTLIFLVLWDQIVKVKREIESQRQQQLERRDF